MSLASNLEHYRAMAEDCQRRIDTMPDSEAELGHRERVARQRDQWIALADELADYLAAGNDDTVELF